MARRMFSPKIVGSDAFLEMPTTSRELYFQLGMYADDDGFVSPRKIMRMVGAGEDDLKVLLGKRFVLAFDNGVIVIKHWRMNNLVRKDWYQETEYLEQKKMLYVKKNGGYTFDPTDAIPISETLVKPTLNTPLTNSLTNSLTIRPHRLGKDRIDKNILRASNEAEEKPRDPKQIGALFEKLRPEFLPKKK